MDNSDIMLLFAIANRRNGYVRYAEQLEDSAAVYEATEILKEDKNELGKLL